jgi:hypothetical protein
LRTSCLRAQNPSVAEDRREPAAVRIDPEPDVDERAVLEQALARLRTATATPGRSAWWRTGIRENVAEVAGERPL